MIDAEPRFVIPHNEIIGELSTIANARHQLRTAMGCLKIELGAILAVQTVARVGADALTTAGYLSPDVTETVKMICDAATGGISFDMVRSLIEVRNEKNRVKAVVEHASNRLQIPARLL